MFAFGGNLFAWWKDAVALRYYITWIKKLAYLLEFKYPRGTNSMQKYLIVHTPGTFGNFLAWLVDCHQTGHVLSEPFGSTGNSHSGNVQTPAWDIIVPWAREKYQQGQVEERKVIGIHWPEHYFPYILHASLDRTDGGQFGKSGVKYLENDFYGYVQKHPSQKNGYSASMAMYIDLLNNYFNFSCTESNPKVPRAVLRNMFWLTFTSQDTHIWTECNKEIQDSTHLKISIETILDYDALKGFMANEFNCELDFAEVHKKFLSLNFSLMEYKLALQIIDAVKNNKKIDIPKLSVVAESHISYELEKHFFDIAFFNVPFHFSDTGQIIEYVAHYPNYMRQPNKFFTTHWKKYNGK